MTAYLHWSDCRSFWAYYLDGKIYSSSQPDEALPDHVEFESAEELDDWMTQQDLQDAVRDAKDLFELGCIPVFRNGEF